RRRNCGSPNAGLGPWSRKARAICASASLSPSSLSGIPARCQEQQGLRTEVGTSQRDIQTGGVTKAGGERTGQKPKASKEETAMTTTIPSSVMYPMILPLKHACRDWLVGVRPAVAFELERLGLLRLTRIDGK